MRDVVDLFVWPGAMHASVSQGAFALPDSTRTYSFVINLLYNLALD
jgi:hypothetical protein